MVEAMEVEETVGGGRAVEQGTENRFRVLVKC